MAIISVRNKTKKITEINLKKPENNIFIRNEEIENRTRETTEK